MTPIRHENKFALSQKQIRPQINWGNPLSRGLLHIWNAADGREMLDLVDGNRGTITGTGTLATSKGYVAYDNGTNASDFIALSTVRHSDTKSVTVAAFCIPAAITRGDILTAWQSGAAAPDQFNLLVGATNGKAQFFASNGSITWNSGTGTDTFSAGQVRMFVGTNDNPNSLISVFMDGIFQSSAATGGTLNQSAGATYRFGNNIAADGYFNGMIIWGAVWNRALSRTEVAVLGRNPWQLYEPRKRILKQGVAAAAVNLTGGGLDTLRAFTETGGGNIGLGGGGLEVLRAFTESGGGTIQSNTTNLTGGAQEVLKSLLERGGGNIGLAGGGTQFLRAFQESGGGISDAPPIQTATRGGRAWWGYESFDGSKKPWWYRDLADKAKELERQRQIRIDLGILPKPEAKKIAKLTKSVDQFIEEMPTPETADKYIARASELADELESLIDQLQNDDDDEVIMTMSRFFFNQRAPVWQMHH